jgi:hypothetical protein
VCILIMPFRKHLIEESGVLHDGDCIVIENRGYVFGREFVGSVADEQASLANRTVTDHDTSK